MTIQQPQSVFTAFGTAVVRWQDRPFLHVPAVALDGVLPFDMSFAQAGDAVDGLRERYRQAGYGAGHRLGLALDNHPTFFLHFLALNACGASIVPLNMGMRAEELALILSAADLDLVVAWPQHLALITDAQRGATAPCPVVAAEVAAYPQASRPECASNAPLAAREAAMIFTSGTTGNPKGCILSNDYFTWTGSFYASIGGHCAFREGEDRILTPLPVTHMNALACSFIVAMMTGSCLIQLDRFRASLWWDLVRSTSATIVHYLGVMPAILLQLEPRADERRALPVRFAFGAGVDPRHHARFEDRFGFPLIEAWAMSETGGGAWITASHEPRHVGERCFGKAPDTIEVRVVDETGVAVAPGTPGELQVRSRGDDPRRHFFSGYYNDDAATEAVWADGWFHTGDIVRRDEEGSFYFVDRTKNIVRRSGENIAAVEVEGVLMRHAAVRGCCVLPVLDEIRGEEVMALIETDHADPGDGLAKEIVRHCLDQLVYFKAPGYIAFVDALPTTSSQKLKRGEIRSLGRYLQETGAAFDLRDLKRSPARAR